MKGRERTTSVWMVSEDADLCQRVHECLDARICPVRLVGREELQQDRNFWWGAEVVPGAILLDPDDDLDWAVGVLHEIKRAHLSSPVVVFTREPNHEFGMKIVSQGISCFLLRDFDRQELRDIIGSLVQGTRQPSS